MARSLTDAEASAVLSACAVDKLFDHGGTGNYLPYCLDRFFNPFHGDEGRVDIGSYDVFIDFGLDALAAALADVRVEFPVEVT